MRGRKSILFLFAAMLAVAGRSAMVYAQEAPSADAPPVSNAPDTTKDIAATPTFRANVNLVSLYFTVRNKQGGLISTLTKNDCNILEDKQQQTVKNFSAEADLPLTLGILLDTSGSQQNVLPMEQQTGSAFVKRILRSKDQAFLVSFDVQVSLMQDFTSNPRAIEKAMSEAEINTGGGGGGVPGIGQGPVPVHGTPKGTLLYDAVYQVATEKLHSETGRKAIILLTDGEDQGSTHKIADAIEAAQKSNLIIYALLIADRGFYFGYNMGYSGASELKKMADETGGRMIDVGNNGKKMEAAFQQIEDELRTQYLASYTPANKKLDGGYRKLDISCKGDGFKVQARKGYYALPPDDQGQ